MLDRESLSIEHQELAGLAGALLACVAQAVPAPEQVARLRWLMSRKLSAHLAKEDRLLYPRIQAGPDRAAAALATRFAHEMGGLAAAFRDYIAGWSPDRIRADWDAFGTETRSVVETLRRRIDREERELYPLIARESARAD